MRKLLSIPMALALVLAISAPAAADPPASSGVVVRFTEHGFGIFPDTDNGYWVFGNIERDTFCTWFLGGMMGPPPMGITADFVKLVFAADAEVVQVKPSRPPHWLHAFTGTDPGDPCTGSEATASLWGDINVQVNDNDGPNMGARANSFGNHGQGILHDADGGAWHYNWTVRLIFAPDENADTLAAPKFAAMHANLKPIGGH